MRTSDGDCVCLEFSSVGHLGSAREDNWVDLLENSYSNDTVGNIKYRSK